MQTLFLIGDSTVHAGGAPFFGWGETLGDLLQGIEVQNFAISGRSTKSFWDEGAFSEVPGRMKKGDLLLICFGHNDEKDDPTRHTDPDTTYQEYLMRYVSAAREKGATPVIVTSTERNFFVGDAEKFLMYTHGEYPRAARVLAERERLPLIDLNAMTRALYLKLGCEGAEKLFVHLAPGENERFPDGHVDRTHFNHEGATEVAQLVADALRGQGLISEGGTCSE